MALAMLKDGCVRICVMYLYLGKDKVTLICLYNIGFKPCLVNTTLKRFRYHRWNFRGMALAMNHEGCGPNACSRTLYFLNS